MRKLCLLACSSLVLLGAIGLGSQPAWAIDDPEPDCDGTTRDVVGFHFGTDPLTGGADASAYGGSALCGSDWDWKVLWWDLKGAYKEGYILTPGQTDVLGGVTLRCANPANTHDKYCSGSDLPSGSYMGSSGVNVIECAGDPSGQYIATVCYFDEDAFSYLYVNQSPGNPKNSECASKKVQACLQSTDSLSLGYGNITVTRCTDNPVCAPYDPKGNRYLMHIYPIKAIWPVKSVWYTEIGEPRDNHSSEPDPRDFVQCKYANVSNPGSKVCGTDPANWVQKNGPAGQYKCSGTGPKPEGAATRAIAEGNLKGIPKDKCFSITWT